MSEISAIPTDSFLDGSGPSKSYEGRRSHSPSRAADLLTGAAAGAGAALIADKVRSRNRGDEKERVIISKGKDKERSDRKSKSSRSRTSSVSDKDPSKTSRRRSSRSHEESLISGVDSSVVSSGLDQHSVRSGASKSSINNPKLLETVEDAIRRLILPELNALKREQSRRGERRSSLTSSGTSYAEKEEEVTDRRRSGASDRPVVTSKDSITRIKERRDREARHDLDASPIHAYDDDESVTESYREIEQTPKRSTDKLKAAAAGAALGGLAVAALADNKSPNLAREQRRRRRAEAKGRSSDRHLDEQDDTDYLHPPAPPMPLMSEINPSEVTRTSILSADSDRPTSASEEFTPVQEVSRGVLANDSGSPTPTKNTGTLQSLGTQHANISHGDLRALPRKGIDEYDEQEYDSAERLRNAPIRPEDDYDEEFEESHQRDADMGQYSDPPYLYSGQVVPAPLKYVPYQPERRGLSPIPSVSGYTEGGSEVQGNRDSRVTHTSASSPDKSPRLDRTLHSPSSIPSNIMAREFEPDDRSLRSSGVDYRNTQFTEDSELDHPPPGQAVRDLGANPNIIHSPMGVESAVASLVDGSMLDESVLTAESGNGGRDLHAHRGSMETLEEEASHGHATPSKRSLGSRHALVEDDEYGRASPATTRTNPSEFGEEYDLDQYGRKVRGQGYRPTAADAAITAGAVGAAAAALRLAQQNKNKQMAPADTYDDRFDGFDGGAIPQRNKSFKERTIDGQRPANTPTHSVDRLVDEYERHPKMQASGIPDHRNPEPELGFYNDDLETNPSVVDGRLDGLQDQEQQQRWSGNQTPTQERHMTPYEEVAHHSEKGSGPGLGIMAAAGAATLATAAALAKSHSRQPSQDPELDEDWHRTSTDRKRDTLVTNPYEGASPIANLPAPNENLLKNTLGPSGYGGDYTTHSPLGHKDEGYISQGPNKTPEVQVNKGKGVDFTDQPDLAGVDDPFYTPKHGRHLSGMSQGMGSPLYDAATGAGIDRIDNKDIVALMQHLMVRDAQRSARDTEILVTLVRAAAEMRENFDKMNKMMIAQEKGLTNELRERIADTEDVIITEVKENTEKTVRNHIGGPRPFPGSGARSLQAGSQAETDDFPTKKQNVFRRALKGLSAKGNNDLGKIEDMLMQLLSEVDVLKAQTGGAGRQGQSLDNMDPEVAYEQDRGYEPEGHAGTSTTSHASQSGHLSINSRGPSTRLGYERKFSDHRISTVPEANEDEFEPQQQYVNQDLLAPEHEIARGGSVPVATPPPSGLPPQGTLSNENTPRTDKGKKHKSGGSVGWFPKISRWSETTTSSVGKVFRSSKDSKRGNDLGEFHSGPSRSGSDLAAFADYPQNDPYGEDKLHTGFSQPDLHHQQQPLTGEQGHRTPLRQTPPLLSTYMTPEDPKYHVHRNSLNLQHPQPRSGQPFKAALESRAEDYDNAMSPKSADWAGSATSLHRFPPQNPHRYSDVSAAQEAPQQFWTSSPANMQQPAGPPRPPKEPIEEHARTPPQARRVNKLQKNSPLPYHSVESGYGTATQGAPSVRSNGSPRPINQNLTSALSMPTRRPSGPRAMTPKSEKSDITEDEMRMAARRKRDTFGTIASQESETF